MNMKPLYGIIIKARIDHDGRYEFIVRDRRNINTYVCSTGDFHFGYEPYEHVYVMSANIHPRKKNWVRNIAVRIEIHSPQYVGLPRPYDLVGKQVYYQFIISFIF